MFAADLVVLVHFCFILFVVLGGLPAMRWQWLIWLHLPAVVWGALIEFSGWICPLTPIENLLRLSAGEAVYANGFIQHYLVPLIYPAELERETQIGLGVAVLVFNAIVYTVGYVRNLRKAYRAARSPV